MAAPDRVLEPCVCRASWLVIVAMPPEPRLRPALSSRERFASSVEVIGAIANYVIGLLTELLGEPPELEKTYAWALGDLSPKTGRARRLPFDAVWESRRLIVEVDEDQHRRPVAHFDKPERLTVSGVHRGEQRGLYAERKRTAARAEGVLRSGDPLGASSPTSDARPRGRQGVAAARTSRIWDRLNSPARAAQPVNTCHSAPRGIRVWRRPRPLRS